MSHPEFVGFFESGVRRGECGGEWRGGPLRSPAVPVCDIHPSSRQHYRATRATIKAHSTHPNHPRPYGSSGPISLGRFIVPTASAKRSAYQYFRPLANPMAYPDQCVNETSSFSARVGYGCAGMGTGSLSLGRSIALSPPHQIVASSAIPTTTRPTVDKTYPGP